MFFNESPVQFTERSLEPRPVSEPEPGFEVECWYSLAGGADIAAFVYAFPTARVLLGSQQIAQARIEVVNVGHTWATRGDENPTHLPIRFRVSLPVGLVEKIQEARAADGPEKDILFEIRAGLGVSKIHVVQEGAKFTYFSTVTVQVYDNQITPDPVRFTRDKWLELIGRLLVTDTLVVELPVSSGTSAAVRAALQHLKAARTAFANGALDDVGGKAFKAFEALVPARGRRRLFTSIKRQYFKNADPSVAQAAQDMLVALSKLYHIGGRHHAGGVPVARHHARFLLGAAEMVIAWCAEVSKE